MKQGTTASGGAESAAIPADTAQALGRAMAAKSGSQAALGAAAKRNTDTN